MPNMVVEAGLALALMALAGLLAIRLRFSIVPLLILVGMLVGPNAPQLGPLDLRLIASSPLLDLMGRLGVLFLLFYLGLEFSVGRLLKAGQVIATGGGIYIGINLTLGLLFGWLMDWPLREVLVVAGITSISSSAIVAKLLVDLRRTANPETEMILGIIMFEDVFLTVYLSLVSALVLAQATSVGGMVFSVLIAGSFVLGLLLLGRWMLPLLNRGLNIVSGEVFLLVLCAGLFLIAGLAETMHVAEAIGALLAGLVLAETEHVERIERLIIPFRDVFGALFFFSFGLSIDPRSLGGAVGPALVAVLLTVLGNYVAGMLAGQAARLSPRAASNIGLTIVARGEFSIILAKLALAGGLLAVVQPFAALYVLLLAVLGPLLSKESRAIHRALTYLVRLVPRRARGRPAAVAADE